jgi:hypothetical protein
MSILPKFVSYSGVLDMERSLQEHIRRRAYEMWNAGGRIDGQADQHWLAAEHEVLAQMTAAISAPKTAAPHKSRCPARHRASTEAQYKRTAKAS